MQPNPSATEVALGYDLDGPPTLARILFDWRFDLVFGTAAIIFAAVYVAGVIRLRRRGDQWPYRTHRGVAARLRAAAVHHVVGPGPLHAGDVQHAHDGPHAAVDAHPDPVGAGAPVTLALRALPTAGKGNPPGPREWLLDGLHSKWSKFFTHPIVATLMFVVVGFYALYFGGIFNSRSATTGRTS